MLDSRNFGKDSVKKIIWCENFWLAQLSFFMIDQNKNLNQHLSSFIDSY